MAAELLIPPFRALDASGNPYSGAKLYFYASPATTTPIDVYTTASLGTAHANPVVADAGGKFPNIYGDATVAYRAVMKDSTGAVTLHDFDPINSSVLALLAASNGSTLVSFLQSGTGADAETVQTALRRIGVHPESFGTVGAGSDDFTPLSQAITAATASGAPLVLTAGKTYLTSAQLSLTDDLRIVGNGAIIKASNSALITGAILRASSVSNIVISDLELDCNGANNGANYGLWITGGANHVIEGLYVHDSKEAGLALEELTKVEVRGGRLVNCGRATNVSGAAATNNHAVMIFTDTNGANTSDVDISGVYIEGAYRKGITTYSGGTGVVSNINIHGNRILTCGVTPSSGGGIYIANAPAAAAQVQVNVSDNILDGNYVNMEVSNLSYGGVTGNVCTASVANNIEVIEASHLVITGNIVDNSGVHGIALNTSSGTNKNLTISGNTVMRSNQSTAGFGAGIWVKNTVTSAIVGNAVNDDATKMTHGIIEEGTSDTNIIAANNVLNASAALYTIAGAATILQSGISIDVTTSYKVAGTKVVGARETGWTAGSGSALKGAFAAYAGQNVSVGYVEAEAQATDDAAKNASQRVKAIEDALRTHGLIN